MRSLMRSMFIGGRNNLFRYKEIVPEAPWKMDTLSGDLMAEGPGSPEEGWLLRTHSVALAIGRG